MRVIRHAHGSRWQRPPRREASPLIPPHPRNSAVTGCGLRAKSISPEYIATKISNFVPPETKDLWRDKIPIGRDGETHELVGAFVHLACDAASYTTGCDVVVRWWALFAIGC